METTGIKRIATQSIEDYLEAILLISKKQEFVRAINIAKALDYTKASVSVAVKKLKEEDLIFFDEQMHIFLTPKGLKIAKNTLKRHKVLKEFFITLGVNEKTADEDACAIEHIISEDTFNAIKRRKKDEVK